MKHILLLLIIIGTGSAHAQKKLVPVSQSPLTGISLPAGAKQDSRFLSELAGKALLEMEIKKSGSTIGKTELLSIPPTPDVQATKDSLKMLLQAAGWSISPAVSGDLHYSWIDRNNIRLLMYLESNKKEISLYFGELNGQTGNQQQQTMPQQPDLQQPQQPDPQQQGGQSQTQQGTQETGGTNPPANNIPPPAGSSGMKISTTNFDDGWVATPQADWVQLTKNNLTTYLHYAIALPDDLVSGDGDPILNYFWNRLITPRYTVGNVQKMPFDPYAYKRTYYMEANATDNNTGQNGFIAFRIMINNGIVSCIEIKAPSKEEYQVQFPDLDKVAAMTGYNRFAIDQSDITGLWKESSGGFAQYYNVYNGSYAGMNAVSITSQLTLTPSGEFLLEHNGASGMVGSQQFFSETYKGNYTISFWDIQTTDQNGKSSAYHAYYQAVKNGRILHLQNKQYSGQEYHLVKAE
jgi:hypothetical protein